MMGGTLKTQEEGTSGSLQMLQFGRELCCGLVCRSFSWPWGGCVHVCACTRAHGCRVSGGWREDN